MLIIHCGLRRLKRTSEFSSNLHAYGPGQRPWAQADSVVTQLVILDAVMVHLSECRVSASECLKGQILYHQINIFRDHRDIRISLSI